MPKLWINSLEDVSEGLRGEYEPVNGKFKLKGEDFEGIDDPQNMRRQLGSANSEAGKRRKDIEKWESLGKTPEEITELLQQQADAQKTELEKKGQWDTLRQQMVDQHTAELQKERKAREDAVTLLENQTIELDAVGALTEHKGSVKVLLPHVKAHVKVMRDDNGKPYTVVLGADGNPRINAEGKPIKVSDFVNEMKSDSEFARAFEGPKGGGGGTPPNSGGGGGTSPGAAKRSEMSLDAKAAYVAEHGQDSYLKLPA